MLKLTVRPISQWPGQREKDRKSSPFRSTYTATLQLLERELDALFARNAVLQMDVDESRIRNDGQLRASTRVTSPAVILAFERFVWSGRYNESGQKIGKYEPLQFPCDRFDDWQDNLRAIALAMEALRKVDRYGVTRSGEQYKGWTALPASGDLQSDHEAAKVLCAAAGTNTVGGVLGSPDVAKAVYREAAKRTHPDTGGEPSAFTAVQEAWGRIKTRLQIA